MSRRDEEPPYALSLRGAIELCARLETHQALGWVLFLAGQNSRNTHELTEEIRRMATNDAQLTQAVTDLLNGYNDLTTAIANEVAALKNKGLDGADPAISTAVTSIEGLVAQMQQATAAASAAIAPAQAIASSTAPADPSTSGSAATAGS